MSDAACAAQISRFSTRLQRKMIKSFNKQIGGYGSVQFWKEFTERDRRRATRERAMPI